MLEFTCDICLKAGRQATAQALPGADLSLLDLELLSGRSYDHSGVLEAYRAHLGTQSDFGLLAGLEGQLLRTGAVEARGKSRYGVAPGGSAVVVLIEEAPPSD